MCNDLVWAVSGRQRPTLPSFTERVNAADGGIDAEWQIEIAETDRGLPTPIVGAGWNVFQYKKRDVIAQDRKRIISNIKSSLKGTLNYLRSQRQRTPDRYILFLNVDLKHDQTLALKDAILDEDDQSPATRVEIIGASEIATFLNSHPHLRAAYFAPLAFKTWDEANRSHRKQKLFGFNVPLVGRQDSLARLKSLVDAPHIRVVVVTGAHDVGKSRLVLEATAHRAQDVVFALDPRSMEIDEYRALVTEDHDVVCVIEDPDVEGVERLINEVLGIDRLRVIVTFPGSEPFPLVSYGQDARVEPLHLEALSSEDSRKLLISTQKRLDFGVESWILDRAGGNPGILLAATSIAEKLRDAPEDFEAAVGKEFARRLKSEMGIHTLKCAELLSLLTHVGISGPFQDEVKLICNIFGNGQRNLPNVITELEGLEKAGLARKGGSFAEITIPFLANYFVTKLLRGQHDKIFALFAGLSQVGQIRFIRRLSQVTSQEVDQFWDALFDGHDSRAPFGSLASALRQEQMLRYIAGATPERTIAMLERGLLQTSHEERLAISGEPRRELMWALEQLLFRRLTSGRALRLIWLLAEAENETFGNNATGVLSECFYPLHSQMPLPLDERLTALRAFTSPEVSRHGKLVAIGAASNALDRHGAFMLRHSTGPQPLDKMPVFTYAEVFKYSQDLVDVILSLGEEPDVAQAALGELPHLVLELGLQGQAGESLERFERLIEWAMGERPGLELFTLFESLDFLSESLRDHLKEPTITEQQKTLFDEYLTRANRLKAKLETGSFSLRLKRWAAGWSREHHEKILVDGVETYRSCFELNKLAKETVSQPLLLTDDLISWLLSVKARNSHMFFSELGKEDFEGRLRTKMEELGAKIEGDRAFSAYWGGWSRRSRTEAERRLEFLAASNALSANAVTLAAAYMGPSEKILRMLEEKVSGLYITPDLLSGILYGDWIRNPSAEQFYRIVSVIAGPTLENAALAIDIIGRWIGEDKPLESELADIAWRCFEAVPRIRREKTYKFDNVAAKLAELEQERGFRLLEKLLQIQHDRLAWNPIDRFGVQENRFWSVFHNSDPERALRTIFRVALTGTPERRFWITSDFGEILDQENDAKILSKLAAENERVAEVIAETVTAARPGFWALAFFIIEKYPSNLNIKSALTRGIAQAEGGWGPLSSHLAASRQEVDRVLNDPATPSAARSWLRDIRNRMEGDVAQHVIWEYDEDVNDLRRYIEIEDRKSPERIWAVARVLKYADWKDIKRMLTVEDIEEVLPQIDLPERKRKTIEKALEVWRVGS